MGYFKGSRLQRILFDKRSSQLWRILPTQIRKPRRLMILLTATPYLLPTAAMPQWYDESAEDDQFTVKVAAIEPALSQSDSSSSSYCPPVSALIPSTPLYGSGSLPHLPNSQSILHSPEPVAEASRGTRASPFPSFHTTRWIPTSGGHAPVPTGIVLFWRVAAGRLCVSCNSGQHGTCELLEGRRYEPWEENALASCTLPPLDCNRAGRSCARGMAKGRLAPHLFTAPDFRLTISPPLLVDLSIFVVKHDPSVTPIASWGW